MFETSSVLTVKNNNQPCYNIHYQMDETKINDCFSEYQIKNHKVCIVTDSNVEKYHMEQLRNQLLLLTESVFVFVFPAGENHKNLETVQNLYRFLIEHSFDRKDALIALGGGVVGDLTGFVAATYLRGISFFQAPTTLLAMVDSSIGGKTGVDFLQFKNMVGAFYMPIGVYMNLNTLKTLPHREYLSGMGEVIKHGLIMDQQYFSWLCAHQEQICNKDMEIILPMVYRSCQIKKEVVERDPKEQNERALLNFGHSIGHAIEKQLDFSLLHGECISIGIVAASYISFKRGYLTQEELEQIKGVLQQFQLPICADFTYEYDVLEAITKDKKMDAGKLKFIVLHGIGTGVIDTTITKEELLNGIRYIKKKM